MAKMHSLGAAIAKNPKAFRIHSEIRVMKVLKLKYFIFFVVFTTLAGPVYSQTDTAKQKASEEARKDKKWYENISIRGYMQVRYNRLAETNPDLS